MRLALPALCLALLACGSSGHWVARPGSDPYADGRCYSQAEAATDTYTCRGLPACISENVRWQNIYEGCMRGSGYFWVEEPRKTEEKRTAADTPCSGTGCW